MTIARSIAAQSPLQERALWTSFALIIFAPYLLINHISASWPAHDMSTPLDHAIPFSVAWEVIYVSIYFYMFIPVVYIRDSEIFKQAVLGFCVIQLSCYAIFLSWPVGIERPALANLEHSFLHWGVALNYVLDQPRNLFPSLHLANAFMVSFLMIRLDRAIGIPALIWAGLIGYSTLAVKHHLLLDVISGIALAWLVDRRLFAPALARTPLPHDLNPRRWLFPLLACYPLGLFGFYGLWKVGWQPFQWPPAYAAAPLF